MFDLNGFSDEIKSKGSWAIWNPNYVKDLDIIEKEKSKLHSRVVFVGLNKSKKVGPWGNFHFSEFDKRLQLGIESLRTEIKEILTGAYMTDLVEDEETPDTYKIMEKFKEPLFIRRQKELLISELETIGANEDTSFILLGKNAAQYFPLFTDGRFRKLIHTVHHSYRFGKGVKANWIETWKRQVEEGLDRYIVKPELV